MSERPDVRSLVAPNIFDASADPNLLLYLVAGNLLSPSTWALADKIRIRAAGAASVDVSPARLLLVEIQRFMNRNFRHLHATDVVKVYGELDIADERRRLGEGPIATVVRNAIAAWEAMIRVNNVAREALQPAFDLVAAGRFPAYFYGNIDLVSANRRLTGTSHASVLGLTSCVDEVAIFAALAMPVNRH